VAPKKPINIDDSLDLSDFFSLVNSEKKKKKEEFQSIVGDLNIESIFEEVKTLKKKNKIKKKKEEKTLEAFESWLYSDKVRKQPIEEVQEIVEEVIEEVQEIVDNIAEEIETPQEEPTLIEKSLGLLAEPSNVKQQKDPLTPLDQKFATLDDLQKHYSTFLSRIQQQLSTIGGGGETKLRYLDDIVGVATNSSAYDQKFLQWNSTTNTAEFVDPNDVGGTTIINISGITTYYQASNVDDYIGVNADVPVTIVLPQIPSYGKKLIVKDEGNKIATYNITVQAGAGTSVENDSSVIMTINHQSFTYFFNGNNWFLI
jgi:predicted transcriptional regulator